MMTSGAGPTAGSGGSSWSRTSAAPTTHSRPCRASGARFAVGLLLEQLVGGRRYYPPGIPTRLYPTPVVPRPCTHPHRTIVTPRPHCRYTPRTDIWSFLDTCRRT